MSSTVARSSVRTSDRLYQELARQIIAELATGKYPVGARLPAERDLALTYDVSRPTVREAIIALEVQGLVEVRVGSGAYVVRLPKARDIPGFGISAIELTEARLLIEGEAAALAALEATEADIAELAALVEAIAAENRNPRGAEKADRAFHLAVARATGNNALLDVVKNLWDLRSTSPEAALLHAKARTSQVKPVVAEHLAVLSAIRSHDPDAARRSMHDHLRAVLDSLLFDAAPDQRSGSPQPADGSA